MRASRIVPLAVQAFGKAISKRLHEFVFSLKIWIEVFSESETGAGARLLHTQPRNADAGRKVLRGALAAGAIGGGVAAYYNWDKIQNFVESNLPISKSLLAVNAATKAKGTPQPNVSCMDFSDLRPHNGHV